MAMRRALALPPQGSGQRTVVERGPVLCVLRLAGQPSKRPSYRAACRCDADATPVFSESQSSAEVNVLLDFALDFAHAHELCEAGSPAPIAHGEQP